MSKPFLTFGDWTVRPVERSIDRHGQRYVLEPRLMDVLMQLADSAGQVVTTEELLATCWAGAVFGDNPVHKSIAMLRKALGDDARAPVYIATIRKRGYRVIARVAFADGRHQSSADAGPWRGGSPYLGDRPFMIEDAPVFFGRRGQRHALLAAVTAAHAKQGAFVLVSGPASTGTTSMVQAGVASALLGDAGYGGIRARACAVVSEVSEGTSCMDALATAMCQWRLAGSAIFALSERGMLARTLDTQTDALLERIRARLRASGDVLVMLVDSLDITLSPDPAAAENREQQCFLRALARIAMSKAVVVLATCRSDAGDALAMCVDKAAGSALVTSYALGAPGPGQLANMIRQPALLAGLTFEEDAMSERRLDDVLLDHACRAGATLSSLQQVMHALYMARTEQRMLTFDAYRKWCCLAADDDDDA